MSVDLSLIYLNDIFHSFQTIVESECLGGSSMLVGEEEGVHEFCNLDSLTFNLHDAIPHPIRRIQKRMISTPRTTLMGSDSHI